MKKRRNRSMRTGQTKGITVQDTQKETWGVLLASRDPRIEDTYSALCESKCRTPTGTLKRYHPKQRIQGHVDRAR